MIRINDKAQMSFGEMERGVDYDTACKLLTKDMVESKSMDKSGFGYIVLRSASFYGLVSKCVIHFRNHRMTEMEFTPIMSYYTDYGHTPDDEDFRSVAENHLDELKKAFGEPTVDPITGKKVFVTPHAIIVSALVEDGSNYYALVI